MNSMMLDLLQAKEHRAQIVKYLDLHSIMEVMKQFLGLRATTKIAVLRWIHHLFSEFHDEVSVKPVKRPSDLTISSLNFTDGRLCNKFDSIIA